MSSKENLTKMNDKEKMEQPKNNSNPRKGRRGSRKTSNEADKDPKKAVADTSKVDPVDMMFM